MKRHAAAALLLSLSACQCGALPPLTLQDFCQSEQTSYCQWGQQCGEVSPHIECRDGWHGRQATRFGLCPALPELSLDAGRIRFDGQEAAACRALRASQCGVPHTCSAGVVGLVPLDGACTSTMECAEGRECAGDTCPGRCQDWRCPGQTPLADGGCEALNLPTGARLGEACGADGDCQESLRCKQGQCLLNFAAEGEACSMGVYCQKGLKCLEGSCARGSAPGAPCQGDTCQVDAFCAEDGGCMRYRQQGETCSGWLPCTAGVRCLRGVCVGEAAVGAACTSHEDCQSTVLSCQAGECQPRCW